MFFLGSVDCIAISISGFYCGYATAIGMAYCMAPTLNYVVGDFALASWGSGSTTCILLAVNRCLDVINPDLGRKLFSGNRTLFWLLIPIACFLYYLLFHTTVTFSPNFYALFFDPFVGNPERHGTVDSENVRNFFIVVLQKFLKIPCFCEMATL